MRSAEHAAAAGWIYSPTRLLPETDDLVHIYRYRHASPGQIAQLHAAYQHAITATEQATAILDTLLTDLCTPGEPYALARALQHNPVAGMNPAPQNTKPSGSRRTTAEELGPCVGNIEYLLHTLKVSDPHLLLRAIALDHATCDLTAEALTKAEKLARVDQGANGRSSKMPRNRSARLAAQDLPGTDRTLTPPAPAAQNRPAARSRLDSHIDRTQRNLRQHSTPTVR